MKDLTIISDLHGELIPIAEPFDILLICGDTCPVECHKRQFQKEWLNDDFVEWVNNLPFKDENSRVVMIGGNHDFYLWNISKTQRKEWEDNVGERLIYLCNESAVVQGLNIYGCPYCRALPGWAFCYDNLEKYYNEIPYDVDILITHDAPKIGTYGTTTEGKYADTDFGNEVLTEYVKDRKPKYHFFGHIHTGDHTLKEHDGIKMANVSIMNESYYPTQMPLKIKIE